MFDANSFLEMSVDQSNDTVSVPVPAGEYLAIAEKIEARPWQSKTDPTKAGMALDILWNIDDAGVKSFLGRDKVTVKQGIMLDVTPEGGLDMGKGKNVGLGRLREACNLNEPGRPFSFRMIEGQMAKVKVTHRLDPNKPDTIYAEVSAVARPA
jgi:hypothetical protein